MRWEHSASRRRAAAKLSPMSASHMVIGRDSWVPRGQQLQSGQGWHGDLWISGGFSSSLELNRPVVSGAKNRGCGCKLYLSHKTFGRMSQSKNFVALSKMFPAFPLGLLFLFCPICFPRFLPHWMAVGGCLQAASYAGRRGSWRVPKACPRQRTASGSWSAGLPAHSVSWPRSGSTPWTPGAPWAAAQVATGWKG